MRKTLPRSLSVDYFLSYLDHKILMMLVNCVCFYSHYCKTALLGSHTDNSAGVSRPVHLKHLCCEQPCCSTVCSHCPWCCSASTTPRSPGCPCSSCYICCGFEAACGEYTLTNDANSSQHTVVKRLVTFDLPAACAASLSAKVSYRSLAQLQLASRETPTVTKLS